MFSFVKMKFRTYNKVWSKICKEKTRFIPQKGWISQPSQTHQEDKRHQCDLRYFKLLIFESLQRQSENHSKYEKLLENHSKQKYYWNSLIRDF